MRKIYNRIFKRKKVVKPYVHRKHEVEQPSTNNNDMVNEDIEPMQEEMQDSIANIKKHMGNKKVKVARKSKELIEQDDNQTVIITEDNKLLLND